jgi:hypothetical protein
MFDLAMDAIRVVGFIVGFILIFVFLKLLNDVINGDSHE